MTKLTIKVNGELVRQGLQNLSNELPKIGRRQLRTMLNRVVRIMQAYPPERPKQTYKRTGELFQSWTIEQIENGYRIGNDATGKNRHPYARYVVGDAYGTSQAWMHKGRWRLYREVVEEEIDKLPPEIEDEIVMVANRIMS